MTNRQLELVKLLENNGSLTIRELSQNLYISESTVRRDLAALEKANLIARTDQGIIALKRDHGGVSLSYSLKTYEKEKRLIAREAVKLVEDKSTIFLSSASTTMFMIPLLARKNKLTIITDGLEHALKAASLGIKTICIGGVVIPSGKTASGLLAEEMLSRLHILFCAARFAYRQCVASFGGENKDHSCHDGQLRSERAAVHHQDHQQYCRNLSGVPYG